ncbi:MAG TPA: hypothetical protein VK034_06250 [Enhygromyxa sp.]|nr:hypothetical protein [Enhygromyxa sp.]
MSEDLLVFQALGAALIGLVLGVCTRRLGWSSIIVGCVAVVACVGLWYVVAWTLAGIPESFGKLVGGSLLVLPGIVGLIAGPLCGGFALSHWLTPDRRAKP